MVTPKINIFIQIDNNYALQYLEGVFIPIPDMNIKAQANTYLLKRVITIISINNLQNLPANEWESGKNDTVKPHKAISGKTPYEFLEDYFNHEV
ncbi:hypothetical protein [Gilliamella sp. ESL0250]|uniref:hypothetical protein n=1 Tax=Gilliamella sp. ESL0250 TaxID=2705036 RepID=UPI001580C323|nr:hypothetical protein [Gilliamella sp. ESL0250]NUF49206.1 hypothetical protein [Gilliamella sp. ESL0250]